MATNTGVVLSQNQSREQNRDHREAIQLREEAELARMRIDSAADLARKRLQDQEKEYEAAKKKIEVALIKQNETELAREHAEEASRAAEANAIVAQSRREREEATTMNLLKQQRDAKAVLNQLQNEAATATQRLRDEDAAAAAAAAMRKQEEHLAEVSRERRLQEEAAEQHAKQNTATAKAHLQEVSGKFQGLQVEASRLQHQIDSTQGLVVANPVATGQNLQVYQDPATTKEPTQASAPVNSVAAKPTTEAIVPFNPADIPLPLDPEDELIEAEHRRMFANRNKDQLSLQQTIANIDSLSRQVVEEGQQLQGSFDFFGSVPKRSMEDSKSTDKGLANRLQKMQGVKYTEEEAKRRSKRIRAKRPSNPSSEKK